MDVTRPVLAAPYVPFKTFLAALEAFARGLPNQVDRSVWPSHSGATQGQLFAAFRFLGLVTDRGLPAPELRALLGNGEIHKEALRHALERAYATIMALDVAHASPKQIEEAFRAYGINGATHRKAVSFFLQAALWCELPLSPLLRRKTRTSGPRRRREHPAPARPAAPEPPASARESKTVQLRSGGALTLVLDVRFSALSKADREFVFNLLDQLAAYEIPE